MVVFSFIGIIISLLIVIIGSVKGKSMIIVGTVAALVCAATGALATACSPELLAAGGYSGFLDAFYDGYAGAYMRGVADIVLELFPLFLAGQLLGTLLDKSGLPVSVASAVFRKMGAKSTVTAVWIVTFILSVAGVNVYVIIFTMYPLAAAFYRESNLPRWLIPANILGAAVAEQALPGVPIFNLVVPAEAFGEPLSTGLVTGIVAFAIIAGINIFYLNKVGNKYMKSGQKFQEREGDVDHYDINTPGLPHPALILVPLGLPIVLMNAFGVPAWAALFVGCAVVAVMFRRRFEGSLMEIIGKGAESAQVIVGTGCLCGLATLIGAVPGYQIVLNFLHGISGGNPYILAAVACTIIAGFAGSAMGGLQFVLANFKDTLLMMGGTASGLTRVICTSALTLDSLPHSAPNIITFQHCGVSMKDGYKHIAFCTILTTSLAAIATVAMASAGLC